MLRVVTLEQDIEYLESPGEQGESLFWPLIGGFDAKIV